MADLSLDAYIAKTHPGNRPMRGGLGDRLGPKSVRGGRGRGRGGMGRGRGGGGGAMAGGGRWGNDQGGNNPKFNVVGLGKVQGFDARQKLSNPLKTTVQDAREKIRPKKNFDARQKIETKKEQMQNLDMRSKIENSKAKNMDARQKIMNARRAKTQNTDPKVMVTGFGKMPGAGQNMQGQNSITLMHGSLTKTIRPTVHNVQVKQPQKQAKRPTPLAQMTPLTRTVDNSAGPMMRHSAPAPVHVRQSRSAPAPSRSQPTGNLVITKRNSTAVRPPPSQSTSRNTISLRGIRSASSEQWTGTESTLRSASNISTMVNIKNDMYRDEDDDMMMDYMRPPPPRPAPAQPVQPMAVWEAIQSVTTKRTPEPAQVRAPVPVTDTVSPLQGYRVLVTNLHPVVSQDDIIELFGAVGALKKARLIKPGTAEVVFVTKEEALAAVRKYHLRELDGMPMQLVLTSRGGGPEAGAATPAPPQRPSGAAPTPTPPAPHPQAPVGGPLRLGQSDVANGKPTSMSVDPNLIHKALFKTQSREEGPTRPVTFTVKI